MRRIPALLMLCAVVSLPMAGCNKKDKESKNPDDAAESDKDPLVELQSIPDQIQAEVDMVLQPINDVDVVIDSVTTMPSRLGVDAGALRGLAKASLDGGTVSVDIDVSTEAKAEIEALLKTIQGIGVGLKELPARAATATKNIVALGGKAAALSGKLTATINGKLANPMLKADKKASLQADLASVTEVTGSIKGTVSDAQATVTSLPAKGTEALAKLTAALAGGGSAGGGEEAASN